jgi:molybdopterin-guanine dinucleotide biosynthesis protein A
VPGYDAAIPVIEGRLQVLHAAYHRDAATKLQAMIEARQHKLQELVPKLRARMVNEMELRRHDHDLLSFFNVNTPADYDRALRLARAKPPS